MSVTVGESHKGITMFNKMKSLLSTKSSATSSIVALHTAGPTPVDSAQLCSFGAGRFLPGMWWVIARRAWWRRRRLLCLLLLYIDGKDVNEHPLLSLLQRPNAMQDRA